MQFLTDFADQAMLLPLAVLVGLSFGLSGQRRAALTWMLAVGGVFGVVLLLKLATLACGLGRPLGIVSPSGHTAGAAVVYGGLATLLLRRRRGVVAAVLAGALPPAVLIGATRLALHMHTLSEVLAGAAIGLAGAAGLAVAARTPVRFPHANRALIALALLGLLLHGHQARAEPRIIWLAKYLWPFSMCVQ